MRDPKSILITGASGGIGAALARRYAGPGITLHLSGRDAGRLDAVARDCAAAGAVARPEVMDVADRDGMIGWIAASDAAAPIELAIANAGLTKDERAQEGAAALDVFDGIIAVNLTGVANTVYPLLEPMRRRRRGQIALIGSLAGWRGFPSSPAYCASKAGVRVLAQGLRARMARDGVAIALADPGFVRTAMTDDSLTPRPFILTADRAAGIIARRLASGAREIAFPWPLVAAERLFLALPLALADRILASR